VTPEFRKEALEHPTSCAWADSQLGLGSALSAGRQRQSFQVRYRGPAESAPGEFRDRRLISLNNKKKKKEKEKRREKKRKEKEPREGGGKERDETSIAELFRALSPDSVRTGKMALPSDAEVRPSRAANRQAQLVGWPRAFSLDSGVTLRPAAPRGAIEKMRDRSLRRAWASRRGNVPLSVVRHTLLLLCAVRGHHPRHFAKGSSA